MIRNHKITAVLVAIVATLGVAAASQAGHSRNSIRDHRGNFVEAAGIAVDAPKADFPAGAPRQAGDPTVFAPRQWKAKDLAQRIERRTRTVANCNCWDQYGAGNIDMKVLLIGADGSEPAYGEWQNLLTREGVPFTAIVAKDAGELTSATFSDGPDHALYQAVVITNDSLLYYNGSAYVSALSPASWAALAAYENQFRIRQVTAVVYPQPQYGLNYPTFAGDFGGQTGTLTAQGRQVFPYLTGTVLYDNGAFGYKATPLANAGFQPLVQAADGSPLVGINTNADGRQELVSTVAQNQWMTQSQLLAHGLLNWATRGTHLGSNRNYLSIHADDAFNADDRWDSVANVTPEGVESRNIVMTPADVTRAVNWQRQTGMRIDLAYNGGAAVEYPALAQSLIQNRRNFGWINHTFTHLNLDTLDTATISGEISQNIQFARTNRLPIDPTELVTGEHSGLNNPNIVQALADNRIAFTGSDASREAGQRAIGTTLTVPRHPTNIFYNVGTKAEQLDEYNYLYFEHCTIGCLSAPATWDQYVANEVAIMFRHVTMNDVAPHYVHVSNLAEEGTMYPVIDAFLAQYRSLFAVPLVDPTLTEAGVENKRDAAWAAAIAAGNVQGTINGTTVTVNSPAGVDVPLTGVSGLSRYGAERSGWARSDGSITGRAA